jgi:hypothetical protein
MANTPYKPDFKYSGNQIILSSGKITLHSSDDSIMLFGKKAIALSSLGTVNLDIKQRLLINAPKIELGLGAERFGQPVILGKTNMELMTRLLEALTAFGKALSTMSETELEKAIPAIVKSGTILSSTCPEIKASLSGSLSNVTYTL